MTERGAATTDEPGPARTPGGLDPMVRRVLDAADVAIAALDAEGLVVTATTAFARHCGRQVDEVVGLHLVGLWPERDRAEVTTALVQLVEGTAEVVNVDTDGSAHGGPHAGSRDRLTLGRMPDGSGRTCGLLCTITAITEDEEVPVPFEQPLQAVPAERRRRPPMEVPAPPTELVPSDRTPDSEALLGPALRRAARLGSPLALLRCEISGLERAVAALGPDGPQHLEACWDRLFERLRATDTVVRTADDTFLVIAQDLGDEQDAAGVAYRLLSAAVEPITVGDRTSSIGMTIGVVIADGAASPARMIEVAEVALTEARRDGVGGFRLVDIRTGLAA